MNYEVNRDRWSTMSLFEQMGNISSEVGRAFKAKRNGNKEDGLQAVIRALDLFDATVDSQIINHPARAKEILRSREQFTEMYISKSPDTPGAKSLENYFMQYAIAERLQKI